MSNVLTKYQKEDKKKLAADLKISNLMAVPRLLKIVINTGLSEALVNKKSLETMGEQIAQISGQKPVVTHARKDISTFKLRKGDPVGLKVTIRGGRMYDFFEKFVSIVLSRIRDFRGVSDKGFDGRGSYSLGLSEQIVFHEIDYSKVDKVRGMEITFVTSGKNAHETRKLLEIMGMPFKKSK